MSLQPPDIFICFASCVYIAETELCSRGVPCQHLFGSSDGQVHGSLSRSWFVVDRR